MQDFQFTHSELLRGQVAVVTGSSRGVGRAIALELAKAGADVIVHGRRPSNELEGVQQAIRSLGRKSAAVTGDLSETASHADLVSAAWQSLGPISIWVNNAGADVLTGDAAHWSFEQKLDVLWKVDVLGTIGLSRLAGQRMAAGGVIVNIGWDQAEQGMAGDSGEMFAATKGAIMAFTRSLAQSLAPRVRVNCVAPGWIRTAWGEQASDYWQQRAKAESLVERWGTPEDVARAVCFLASPATEFITGQTLKVNGGFRFGSPAR